MNNSCFLKTNLIKIDKNHMIPFKISQKIGETSNSKECFDLLCSPYELHQMTPFTTTGNEIITFGDNEF